MPAVEMCWGWFCWADACGLADSCLMVETACGPDTTVGWAEPCGWDLGGTYVPDVVILLFATWWVWLVRIETGSQI